ncbi:hypothetical protein ACS0TY_035426 [Phlomoides rotata]
MPLQSFHPCLMSPSLWPGKIDPSAMALTNKYEEISPPHIEDFCYVTDNAYTKEECSAILEKHQSTITSIAIIEDGWTLLTAGRDKVVNLWNLHDYSCRTIVPTYEALEAVCTLHSASPFALCLSSFIQKQGKKTSSSSIQFLTLGERGIVRIWNSNGLCMFLRHMVIILLVKLIWSISQSTSSYHHHVLEVCSLSESRFAASSMEQGIITKVAIGNGTILSGKAVNSFSLSGKSFTLVYGEGASRVCNPVDSRDCLAGCLDKSLVQGKIVLCKVYNGITEASTVGDVGSVTCLQSGPEFSLSDVSFVVPVAGSSLKEDDFNLVERYFNSTK